MEVLVPPHETQIIKEDRRKYENAAVLKIFVQREDNRPGGHWLKEKEVTLFLRKGDGMFAGLLSRIREVGGNFQKPIGRRFSFSNN